MRHLISLALLLVMSASLLAAEPYKYGPDSERQDGVPKGAVTKHSWKSKIFEGTIRDYYLYIPAQYDGQTPAAVMVFQDGHTYVGRKGDFRVPVVFDNLIHKQEMPLTIAILINPGHKADTAAENPWRVDNRSFEYDTLSHQYARFLIEEILPEIGKDYKLTDDPEQRGKPAKRPPPRGPAENRCRALERDFEDTPPGSPACRAW